MQHSPRITRSQAASEAGSESRRTAEMAEAQTLQTILGELQRLREEREQERRELADLRRRVTERGQGEEGATQQGQCFSNLKLKSDNFDGTGSFDEFIAQFEIIAKANKWSQDERALVLAAKLRGKARSILEGIGENLDYAELKYKLESRFGERTSFQNYYLQFTNRKMKFDEDFACFGGDLERLARLAYPECNFEIRDKIACGQFIAGLTEGFVKRTLQLEGLISLREAVERAKVIFSISGRENFSQKQEQREGKLQESYSFKIAGGDRNYKQERGREFSQNIRRNEKSNWGRLREKRGEGTKEEAEWKRKKECWLCGSLGHFRAECPSLINKHPN